jgi:hypothetical protein
MKFIKKLFNGTERTSTNKSPNTSTTNKPKRPVKVLTAKDIAEKLEMDRRKLEQTFLGLGWTEKIGRGLVATQDGINNGAQTKYHDMSKNRYVVWDENILENEALKEFYHSK